MMTGHSLTFDNRSGAMGNRTKQVFFALAWILIAGPPAGLSAQVTPSGPGLKPGDLVRIAVWQRDELSGEFTVGQDGTLVHPLYRQVRVSGLGSGEVEGRLRSFLSQYEANPQVVVQPLYQVAVAGQVMRPDIYSLPAGTTVSQAVVQAGGVTEAGKMDDVRLTREGRTTEVDLRSPATVSMPVQSGDQILVPARTTTGVVRNTIMPLIQVGLMIGNIVVLATR